MALAKIDRDSRNGGPAEGQRRVVATSPPNVMELRQVYNGIHRTFGKKMLDLFELAIGNDRQWEKARHLALDIIEEEYRVVARAMTTMLAGQEAAEVLAQQDEARRPARKKESQ